MHITNATKLLQKGTSDAIFLCVNAPVGFGISTHKKKLEN